jgi:hypothetical protein
MPPASSPQVSQMIFFLFWSPYYFCSFFLADPDSAKYAVPGEGFGQILPTKLEQFQQFD